MPRGASASVAAATVALPAASSPRGRQTISSSTANSSQRVPVSSSHWPSASSPASSAEAAAVPQTYPLPPVSGEKASALGPGLAK